RHGWQSQLDGVRCLVLGSLSPPLFLSGDHNLITADKFTVFVVDIDNVHKPVMINRMLIWNLLKLYHTRKAKHVYGAHRLRRLNLVLIQE
ncbi:MAG: hypothetical protein QNI91_11050, partial [Arenicellales bacterium]|nr:hypothetical protein [Arenicellales bacterium]